MKRFFVTASGTGTGKTFLARALITKLRARGISVHAVKPVITGFDAAAAAGSDAGLLLGALGLPINGANLDRISPWRFRAPLSPDLAAARERRTVPFADLVRFSSAGADADITLIEGIGGVMVPLDERHTVLDWIAELGSNTLLVAGTYLGALSHALTALEALRSRSIPVQGIIVTESMRPAVSAIETAGVLRRFSRGTRVVVLPRVRNVEDAPDLTDLLTGPGIPIFPASRSGAA